MKRRVAVSFRRVACISLPQEILHIENQHHAHAEPGDDGAEQCAQDRVAWNEADAVHEACRQPPHDQHERAVSDEAAVLDGQRSRKQRDESMSTNAAVSVMPRTHPRSSMAIMSVSPCGRAAGTAFRCSVWFCGFGGLVVVCVLVSCC